MRKTRSRKWRHVYPYICIGCGKKRIAFEHDRAKAETCKKCEKDRVPTNQPKLF